jgi:iron complex outermembrane receptor protein
MVVIYCKSITNQFKATQPPGAAKNVCLLLLIGSFLGIHSSSSLAQEGVGESEKKAGVAELRESGDIPTIVIKADPLSQSLLEFSRPASVLHGERLQERLRSTVGETVDLQPGVRSSFFGPGASRPVIRGFSGERVRTLRNGVSTGDVSSLSDDHVVVADPLQAEQIEILRGPETLLYGSSAIGGAVNVNDGSIAESSLGRPFEGAVLGQFGNSADNEKSEAVRLRGESGSVNWYGGFFSRRTSSYEIPGLAESEQLREREELAEGGEQLEDESHNEYEAGGIVSNSDSQTYGGTIGASHIFEEGFVGLALSGFDSAYGVPGHGHGHEDSKDEGSSSDGEGHGSDDVRIDAKQLRADLRGRYDFDASIESIKFRVGATDYEHTEFEGGAVGNLFEKDGIEGRLEFIHQPIGPVTGVFGIHSIYDDFSAQGEEAFIPATKSNTEALFFFEKVQLTEPFSLQGGGRFESVSHDPITGDPYKSNPMSISGGFRWELDTEGVYSIGSSLDYAERAASPIELYADGIHYARRITERGNSALSKERSTGLDLSFHKTKGMLTASITPFYQRFASYFNLRGVGGAEEEFPLFVYDDTGATFWGGEFLSSLHVDQIVPMFGHRLTLDFQGDLVRTRDRDGDSYIPRTPPLRYILRGRWELPEAVEMMVEAVRVEAQRRLAAGEIPTDGYSMFNTEVSYRWGDEPRSLRLFVRGTNLTDEEARVHSSFLKDLAPLRGRSLLFGFRGMF